MERPRNDSAMQFIEDGLHHAKHRVVMPLGTNETATIQENLMGDMQHTIYPFTSTYPLSASQIHILTTIAPFFSKENLATVLHPFASNESDVSLRCLDWLVTNFSKKYNILCRGMDGHMYNIFSGYKLCLTNYRRRNFDPFRRRLRIHYTFEGSQHETTVGQVNFLYWAAKNGVLDYARQYRLMIEEDMNKNNARKRKHISKKRTEISRTPTARCFVYNIHTNLKLSTG